MESSSPRIGETRQGEGRGFERIVIISGLSGAGKSTALHALEDLGYFCVDNLPTTVVKKVIESCRQARVSHIALGIDVRVRAFLQEFGTAVDSILSEPNVRLSIVFLDASDPVLLARFSATRRPHPLSTCAEGHEREATAVLDGVTAERARLARVRARATDVIDTTALSVHDLRRRVVELFGPGAAQTSRMRLRVLSFGFKYGVPVDADVMLDVRFLNNPYFIDELRPLTGLDEPVASYVMAEPDTVQFLELARQLVVFGIPRYEREGKSYLTIAVGCTGGRHRSVVVAEQLGRQIAQASGLQVRVVHRDVDRDVFSERRSDPDARRGTGFGPGEK